MVAFCRCGGSVGWGVRIGIKFVVVGVVALDVVVAVVV